MHRQTAGVFAERFLTPLLEGPSGPEYRYDETCGYNVTTDGMPVVEAAIFGQTRTSSEVQAERDDSDDDVRTRTSTFVEAEAEDYEATLSVRTETAIKAERPDYGNWWASTETFTKVQAETGDRD